MVTIKPSIQKLVVSVMRDVLQNKICKEALRKFPPFEIHARLNQAVEDLRAQLSELPLDFDLVKKMSVAGSSYQERNEETYNELVCLIFYRCVTSCAYISPDCRCCCYRKGTADTR